MTQLIHVSGRKITVYLLLLLFFMMNSFKKSFALSDFNIDDVGDERVYVMPKVQKTTSKIRVQN